MELDTDIDSVSGLTEDEKYVNFLNIMNTVRYIENGGLATTEWVDEQKKNVVMYREWISDYSKINEEIEDDDFRKCCSETEVLLQNLCHMIEKQGILNLKLFGMFMKHMKHILDTVFTDDQMAELLEKLSL